MLNSKEDIKGTFVTSHVLLLNAPRRPVQEGSPNHSRFLLHFSCLPIINVEPLWDSLAPRCVCIHFCSSLNSDHWSTSVRCVFGSLPLALLLFLPTLTLRRWGTRLFLSGVFESLPWLFPSQVLGSFPWLFLFLLIFPCSSSSQHISMRRLLLLLGRVDRGARSDTKIPAGHGRLWPIRLWPNPFWPNGLRLVCVCLCVFVRVFVCVLVSRFPCGGFKVLVWSCSVPPGPPFPGPPFPGPPFPGPPFPGPPFPGPPSAGPAQISLFFTLSRRKIRSFLPSLGVFSLNLGGVFEDREPQMCTFGVLGLSCASPGGPVWWGRRGFTRQPESPNVHI